MPSNERRYDFVKDYNELAERCGVDSAVYNASDLQRDLGKYVVLGFECNRQKGGVMSRYKGKAVFVHKGYMGEPMQENEFALCVLYPYENVYYAMPLFKITPSLLMGLNEDVREGIIKALWTSNRKEYESIFEERFRNKMETEIREETERRSESRIAELNERIAELSRDLQASRFALESAQSGKDPCDDEIELSSDGTVERDEDEIELSSKISEETVRVMADDRRTVMLTDRMPTDYNQYPYVLPFGEGPAYGAMDQNRIMEDLGIGSARMIPISVWHRSPRKLQSSYFVDSRYFVHVSPNKKLMLIRPDEEGPIFCVNRSVLIQDLDQLIKFKTERELKSEYSKKYKGILVHLDL